MYAGLITADKGALLDAKARGFKTVKPFHQSANEWDVDLALAQIAEMESAENPLTCDGCDNKDKFDYSREVGRQCPCTHCKRIAPDRYEPKGEKA